MWEVPADKDNVEYWRKSCSGPKHTSESQIPWMNILVIKYYFIIKIFSYKIFIII